MATYLSESLETKTEAALDSESCLWCVPNPNFQQIIFTSTTLLSHLENRDKIRFACMSHLCLSNKRLDYAEQHVSVLWEEPEWGWMAAEIHLFIHTFGDGITEYLDTWILIP